MTEKHDSCAIAMHLNLNGPNKGEKAHASGDILFVPMCKWDWLLHKKNHCATGTRVTAMDASSRVLMNW